MTQYAPYIIAFIVQTIAFCVWIVKSNNKFDKAIELLQNENINLKENLKSEKAKTDKFIERYAEDDKIKNHDLTTIKEQMRNIDEKLKEVKEDAKDKNNWLTEQLTKVHSLINEASQYMQVILLKEAKTRKA